MLKLYSHETFLSETDVFIELSWARLSNDKSNGQTEERVCFLLRSKPKAKRV